MSETVKKPVQRPDSYKPGEKPGIVNLAEQKSSKVIFKNNGAYIDSVPPIGWGEWRECTYSGCMTLLLNALGAKATYEQVMGLTGSCYRASMAYGWDPGSNIVNITYAHLGINSDKNANRHYGINDKPIDMDKTTDEEREVMARESIDAGVPVLVLGSRGPAEWGVLLGYEKSPDGFKYFGRSYFDDEYYDYVAAANEIFTDNKYVLACNFPKKERQMFWGKLFNDSCEPSPALDALRVSLETCLEMFKPHERFGYGAYDKMIQGFENNKFKRDWGSDDNSRDGDVGSIIRNLTDARRAAHIYLTESAEILTGDNKAKLSKAASLYKGMFDTLQGVMPYEDDFDQNAMTEETRRNFAEALRKCKDLEYKAHDIIKEILVNWER